MVLLACTALACTAPNPRFLILDAGVPNGGPVPGGTGGSINGLGGNGPTFPGNSGGTSGDSGSGLGGAGGQHIVLPPDAGTPDTLTGIDQAPVLDVLVPPVDVGTIDVPPAPDLATDLTTPVDLPPPVDAAPTLNTGLIGYWRFDDADNAVVIRDSSGRGHDGRIEGNTAGAGFVTGRFARAYHITQRNLDYGIRVEATPAIKNIKQYTLAAWVYRYTTRAEYNTIISRQLNATDAEVLNLSISHDVAKLYASDRLPTKEVTVAWSRTPAPVGAWFHVAGTYDGTQLALYQNGVLVDTVPYNVPQPPTDTPLYLATNKNPNETQPFYGIMDEVMLYDVALPPHLIAALARGERPNVP